jgi:hypothetical protein
MNPTTQSPIKLALKILSAHYRQATGECITEADVAELRSWVGEGAEEMSAVDAACLVIRRELAAVRDGPHRIQ